MRTEQRGARLIDLLWRDTALRVSVALTLLGCALFFVFDGDSVRQVQVYWAFQVPLDAALALGAWRIREISPRRFRTFWTILAFAGSCFAVGDAVQTVLTFVHTDSPSMNGGLVQTAFFAVGMSSNVIACLIFPQGLSTRREKSIFWLDATTVIVGGGVTAWCFAVNPLGGAHSDRLTASLTAALVVVAAFSATKVALIKAPPMARIAAWPMVAAASMQGISTFLPGDFQEASHPYVFTIRLVPSLLIAVGPWVQAGVLRSGRTYRATKRRPYSLLPYGMIGLTFVIFFAMLPDQASSQLWGAAIGVVVISCLVAGRQLVAFHDNMQLIDRLDVALDEVRGHEAQLLAQASTDGLTGLANRTRFAALLDEEMSAADGVSVLLIDLDDFKTVNDTLGHAAGDALLVSVSERLRDAVRTGDVVARLGGDEFAILLPGADAAAAGWVADDIQRRLTEPMDVRGHVLVTRASVGVARSRPGDDQSVLLSNADIAMYEAKRRGKSMWVEYTDAMGARISAEARLSREMAQAVERGEFTLLYQPIVRLSDGVLTGVESLIRWNHPTRGLVTPGEFIPVAERTGQIVAVGRWALREACRQAAEWRRSFPAAAELRVGVNVAGRQLREPGFVAEVDAVLTETGLPPSHLNIEVTETAVFDDEESTEVLFDLRGHGVRLSLDDFGTAASSLGLLLTTPVTSLKLDRSFVESITTVGRQAAVANAVSQMAAALELASVAEGIETAEQRVVLQDLGYRYGQGFLFARPLPAAEIASAWLSGHARLPA
ncbi:EAL domain-containing protein [Actinoplanes sp. LDG1-06]|uniref:EAL domain-containing protein n=1 Tax=Paractinoplanes ovalisporus TaxID=2810368 RepID=A0ABS2AF38_9ACTN|nr:EAL domain-containing protein [Actinoplanes ovalisporus]MBM2618437.1 EAL domain-containing protein [Actinoplanes ovalisporus]